MRAAFAAGVRDFGENRVQEAEPKIAATRRPRAAALRWHLVGHLQSNKARRAAALFGLVQSVDSLELAERLARVGAEEPAVRCAASSRWTSPGEETKFGLPEAELLPALEPLRGQDGLRLEGLMVAAAALRGPGARCGPSSGACGRSATGRSAAGLLAGRELSMGMSHDFEAAVEEGATLVRVGHRDLRGAARRPDGRGGDVEAMLVLANVLAGRGRGARRVS